MHGEEVINTVNPTTQKTTSVAIFVKNYLQHSVSSNFWIFAYWIVITQLKKLKTVLQLKSLHIHLYMLFCLSLRIRS